MNKKRRSTIRQGKEIHENLPITSLVARINNSLEILQKRGISISDWDKKERKLYGIKIFGGRVYFLAADLDKSK